MNNMIKKIGIILLGILILVGGIFMVLQFMKQQKLKNSELESCFSSTGGGMDGGYSRATIKKEDDGSVTLTVINQQYHYTREETTVYQVDPKVLEDIKEIVLKYDLYGASKRPNSPVVAYDAPTSTIGFDFTEDYFSIGDYQVLSNKQNEGWHKFIEYLNSIERKDGVKTVAPQEAVLSMPTGYTFTFYVDEAFDGKLDDVLVESDEVKKYEDVGIVYKTVKDLDVSGGKESTLGEKCTFVYKKDTGEIILLYADTEFEEPVVLLAELDYKTESALPHFEQMEGTYYMRLN